MTAITSLLAILSDYICQSICLSACLSVYYCIQGVGLQYDARHRRGVVQRKLSSVNERSASTSRHETFCSLTFREAPLIEVQIDSGSISSVAHSASRVSVDQ